MNEEPKSIWKKSWTGPRNLLLAWLGLVIVTLIFFAIITLAAGARITSEESKLWLALLLCATMVFFLVLFIRWLFCWRNFKRFIFGVACLATLIALAYAEEDWRGWHAWNQFKHAWEAKGEKFDFKDFIPPPVPDDQNFALTPIVASSYATWLNKSGQEIMPRNTNVVNRLEMEIEDYRYNDWLTLTNGGGWQLAKMCDLKVWQSYYRALAAKTNEYPVPPQPQSPAQDVLLALGKYDSTIDELREASKLPYSRFPLNYEKQPPAAILLPHLARLKQCARVLRLRAIAELQNGQSDKTLADVNLSLRLVDSIRTEPFLISHLVRIAMLQIMIQPVYEGLANHQWTAAQLAELDAELARLNFVADYQLAMRGEMDFGQIGEMEYLRHHPEQLSNLSDGGDDNPPPGGIIVHFIPSGWFYQNQLHCARPMVELILPVADMSRQTISPEKIRKADATIAAQTRRPNAFNFMEHLFLPSLGDAAHFAYGQAGVDLARTAIALERYRLAHGEYPGTLDALAPQFMEKVPHDVIGGGPLHYRRTDDGQFVLYSVGWNERDDGGVVVFNKGSTQVVNRDEGDWVWRYPQK